MRDTPQNTVYYGDVSKRLTIRLPPSLLVLRRRAAEAFGLQQKDFQFYRDPAAKGRGQGGIGRIHVTSEALYKQILADDVVVIVAAGKQLGADDVAKLFSTTNQRDYVPHPVEPPMKERPQSAVVSNKAKFYDETSYHRDYPPKKVSPNTPRVRAMKALNADRKISSSTTHQDTYVPHPLPAGVPPKTPSDKKPFNPPFEKLTTNRRDYTKKPLPEELVRYKETRRELKPGKTGVTEFQASYVPKPLSPVMPIRPHSAAASHRPWVPPTTSYKQDYVRLEVEERIHLEPCKATSQPPPPEKPPAHPRPQPRPHVHPPPPPHHYYPHPHPQTGFR